MARARLLREARNAAALNHPNICTVYEVGEADGRAFIAMEYVDGRPLSDRLAESALSLEEAVRYGIEAADALAYAHDHGVIHRDLKAANAIVTTTGRSKLVDFGLARREDALLADATTMPSVAPAGVARRHARTRWRRNRCAATSRMRAPTSGRSACCCMRW